MSGYSMEEWMQEHANKGLNFITDGIPFPEEYAKNENRVLFILKEPHDLDTKQVGDQIKCYRDYALNGKMAFSIIGRLAELYKVVANDSNMESREAVKNFAFMNPKKCGGGTNCDEPVFMDYCYEYREYIKAQIREIDPKYIICLGSFGAIVKCVIKGILPKSGEHWKKKNKDFVDIYECRYRRDDDDIPYEIIFNMKHPSLYGVYDKDYKDDFKDNYSAVTKML